MASNSHFCTFDGVAHAEKKRKNPEWRFCKNCGAELPSSTSSRSDTPPAASKTEVIVISDSPCKLQPRLPASSTESRSQSGLVIPRLPGRDMRDNLHSHGFAKSIEMATADRAHSISETAKPKSSKTILLAVNLHLGFHTKIQVGDITLTKYKDCNTAHRFMPTKLLLDVEYQSFQELSKSLLDDFLETTPNFQSHPWRMIHSITPGNNPSPTELARIPTGPITLRALLFDILSFPNNDKRGAPPVLHYFYSAPMTEERKGKGGSKTARVEPQSGSDSELVKLEQLVKPEPLDDSHIIKQERGSSAKRGRGRGGVARRGGGSGTKRNSAARKAVKVEADLERDLKTEVDPESMNKKPVKFEMNTRRITRGTASPERVPGSTRKQSYTGLTELSSPEVGEQEDELFGEDPFLSDGNPT